MELADMLRATADSLLDAWAWGDRARAALDCWRDARTVAP